MPLRKYLPFITVGAAIIALYLVGLAAVGVLEPDEPRYTAIGQAMARTGDFITPRLWGTPWFEKPPLLYWMTASGTALGLGPELSGRLPVAILSLVYLAAFYWLLKVEFGAQAAGVSTAMLATSAGWLAYSEFCLTDVPVAIFFSLATLLALPLLRVEPPVDGLGWRFLAIGVALGLGTLAKGLVPIALSLPFFWFLRRFWSKWWFSAVGCCVVALPWYLAVYAINGHQFIQDFFVHHHLERLYSASLQHVQPWYYYIPVLLAGMFPWTPAIAMLARRDTMSDGRRRFLMAVTGFGLVFFSLSLNKLPGYVMPILPSLFAVVGARFENRSFPEIKRGWLLACAILVALIPLIAEILPASLAAGRFSTAGLIANRTTLFYVALPVIAVLLARRSWVGPVLALSAVAAAMYLKAVTYPVLDREVSARGLWKQVRGISDELCDAGTNRNWIYGLNFYHGAEIPVCGRGRGYRFEIRSYGHSRPFITPVDEGPR